MDNTIRSENIKNKKKKVKKIKPPKMIYNEFIYSPALQKVKPAAVAAGIVFRALIAYVMTMGLILFINDAFKIKINITLLALITLIPVMVFTLMSLKRLFFIIGAVLTAAAAVVVSVASGNIVGFWMNSAGTLWNHILDRLDYVGYKISERAYLPVDNTVIFTNEQTLRYMFYAMIILACVFSAVGCFSIIRRVRVIPITIMCAAIMTSIFTYNLNSSNWGFTLVIVAVCGLLATKMYDSIYNRSAPKKDIGTNSIDKKSIKNAAYGGFAGAVTMVICFLALLLPTISCRNQWETINFISEPMELGRAIVQSVIIGETPDIDMGFLGNMDTLNSRSTVAEDRNFTGKQMLLVYSSYNMPMYLRSWVGSVYNEDSWSTVSTSKAKQYTSWFYEGFTPEMINYNFWKLINPKLVNVNSYTSYSNHIEEGFITETVDIQNLNSSGNLLFLGNTYNPEYGLLEFMTEDKTNLYKGEWKFYYEGIVTTSWFNFNKNYRMISYVTSYRHEDYAKTLDNNTEYYQLMKYYITQYADIKAGSAEADTAINAVREMLDYYNLTYTSPNAFERYLELNESERQKFIYDHFLLSDHYQEFVFNEYLEIPEEDEKTLDEIALEILNNINYTAESNQQIIKSVTSDPSDVKAHPALASLSRHDIVLAVVDYLKNNYQYTLTPLTQTNTRISALNSFLTSTKEGYCVQFATSAAMILRTMGIPTRYVEGYLVNNLAYDKSEDRLAKYRGIVHDYNAHAWIEVYMGSVGWMLYETTPDYYSDLYEPYSSSQGSVSPSYNIPTLETAPETEELEDETIDEESEKTEFDFRAIIVIVIIIGVLGLLSIPIYVIMKMRDKSIRAFEKRYELINRAMRAQLEPEEMREIARKLNDYIWQFHNVAKCLPENGEMPNEYALRVDDSINDSLFSFNDILSYMNCEEFGYGMARWQLREAAEYTEILWNKLYGSLSRFKQFKYRHIKRVI